MSWSDALTDPAPAVETGSALPIIAAGDGEYPVAWRHFAGDENGLQFSILKQATSGELSGCSPTFYGLGNVYPWQIASRTGGYLISVYAEASGASDQLELLRVDSSCAFVPGAIVVHEVAPDETLAGFDMARGAEGYLAVWSFLSGTAIHGRVFGPNLCD